MSEYESSEIDHKPPPKISAGCMTVMGFWTRLICYVTIGVAAAIAAAAEAGAVKNAKDYSAGDNSCPYTYDYVARDQKRVSTCGFIRFIAIFSTIVAWLMLAFTAYKIYSSSFALKKSVVIELVLAGFGLIMVLIAAALAHSEASYTRVGCFNLGSFDDRENRSSNPTAFKKMLKDMFLTEEALWATSVAWALLFAVLLWRACVACKGGKTADVTFNNPNAADDENQADHPAVV